MKSAIVLNTAFYKIYKIFQDTYLVDNPVLSRLSRKFAVLPIDTIVYWTHSFNSISFNDKCMAE